MKLLENFFKEKEPLFHKGEKYEKWHPLFHALYSFFFNNHIKTNSNVHIRDSLDTKRYMTIVIMGLIPSLLFGIYNAGLQSRMAFGLDLDFMSVILSGASIVLPIVAVSYGVGLMIEFASSYIRGHDVNEGFLVTGLIFPLTLPPAIPLWQVAVGVAFGVIIGKEVFGGTGRNFLNPALTARCFIFFAYPAQMSGEVWTYMIDSKDKLIDGFSGATALAVASQTPKGASAQDSLMNAGFSFEDLFFGFVPGSIGETSTLAILVGAIWLLFTGVASWRTMLSALVGAIIAIMIFNIFGSNNTPMSQLPLHWHLVTGGFAFAIVFIATDPVSSPYIKTSMLIYGFLIGTLGMVIRVFNPAYVESWMLIILLMNVFAPLIDHIVMQIKKSKRIPNLV